MLLNGEKIFCPFFSHPDQKTEGGHLPREIGHLLAEVGHHLEEIDHHLGEVGHLQEKVDHHLGGTGKERGSAETQPHQPNRNLNQTNRKTVVNRKVRLRTLCYGRI